jgi:acyl-CoA synthetase (AMP-forming)/AMP-acid ligase II
VRHSVVAGVPDERWGQILAAFIVTDSRKDGRQIGEELKSFMSERVSSYKVPEQFIVVDSLPHNATGKIDRKQLKEISLRHFPMNQPPVR